MIHSFHFSAILNAWGFLTERKFLIPNFQVPAAILHLFHILQFIPTVIKIMPIFIAAVFRAVVGANNGMPCALGGKEETNDNPAKKAGCNSEEIFFFAQFHCFC